MYAPWNKAIAITAALLFVACGPADDEEANDADENNAATFDIDAEDSRVISDLSDAEIDQVCMTYESYVDSQISPEEQQRFLCTFLGAFSAAFTSPSTDEELQSQCAMLRDECLMDEQMEQPEEDACPLREETCDATVAEIEACIVDYIDALKPVYAEFQCENATLESGDDDSMDIEPELPPSCAPVEMKCPGFFEDEDDSMEGAM